MRKLLVLLGLVVGGICATSATAAAPSKLSFSISNATATLSGVCSFDVDIASQLSGFEIDYFDADGALTRIYDHVTEQDTFSHDGTTLTGLPYTFNIEVLFDSSGDVTHIYASGEVSRVPLPVKPAPTRIVLLVMPLLLTAWVAPAVWLFTYVLQLPPVCCMTPT